MCHNERMGFAPYFSLQADLVSTCQLSSRFCGKAICMVSTQSTNYAKLPRNMCEDKACLLGWSLPTWFTCASKTHRLELGHSRYLPIALHFLL